MSEIVNVTTISWELLVGLPVEDETVDVVGNGQGYTVATISKRGLFAAISAGEGNSSASISEGDTRSVVGNGQGGTSATLATVKAVTFTGVSNGQGQTYATIRNGAAPAASARRVILIRR